VTGPQSPSLFKSATIISVAYVMSRLLGYVREAMLAARFGATHTTDAYLVAQEIPSFLFMAVGSALLMVFIPVYRGVVVRQGEEAGWRLVSGVANATLLGAIIITGLGWALVPWLVPWLVPGLPDAVKDLAVALTLVMLPMMVFLGLSALASAVLNANRRFTAPALVSLASNVLVIGTLLAVTRPGQIYWVANAAVLGAVAGLVIQLPALPGLGFRYRALLFWRDPAVGQVGRLLLPVAFTTGAIQLQSFATRYMASNLAEGSISALNYAVRLNSLPYGVVGAAIATVLYPNLADQVATGRTDDLRRTITGGLRLFAYVLLPMALGLFAFREPIVRLFFQRGAFNPQATAVTAYALAYYAPGILFFGWLDFLSRCYFAMQDPATPMWTGFGMVGVTVGLNYALIGPFAQGGLALGTTLSTAVAVLFLLWRLQRRVGGLSMGTLTWSTVSALGTSALGAVAGVWLYRFAGAWLSADRFLTEAVRLGIGLGTVVVVHVGAGIALGSRDGTEFAAMLGRRFSRHRGT